jgi:hypothetical protein
MRRDTFTVSKRNLKNTPQWQTNNEKQTTVREIFRFIPKDSRIQKHCYNKNAERWQDVFPYKIQKEAYPLSLYYENGHTAYKADNKLYQIE